MLNFRSTQTCYGTIRGAQSHPEKPCREDFLSNFRFRLSEYRTTALALVIAMEGITDGYPGLAKLMGPYVDLALYRRFSELSARNLLYMQAEVMFLEGELWRLGHEDQTSGDIDRRAYSQNVKKMIQGSRAEGSKQWDKIMEIRLKMKDYSRFRHDIWSV